MKVKLRAILTEAIERGIAFGIKRTIKYADEGSGDALRDLEERLTENLDLEVWNAIDEWLSFEDEMGEL